MKILNVMHSQERHPDDAKHPSGPILKKGITKAFSISWATLRLSSWVKHSELPQAFQNAVNPSMGARARTSCSRSFGKPCESSSVTNHVRHSDDAKHPSGSILKFILAKAGILFNLGKTYLNEIPAYARMTALFLALTPIIASAVVFQYDPQARLQTLQANYPGGIDAVYGFCTTKYATKISALQALGVQQTPQEKSSDLYTFMAKCIYGNEAYISATCNFGGNSCQKVALPIDLKTLNSMTKNIKPEPVGQMPSTIY